MAEKKTIKNMRDNLRTSQQQGAYAQLIAKEQSQVASMNKKNISKMENLFAVNNKYLGLFKKDDVNNQSIKIGSNLYDIDASKVDPTRDKTFQKDKILPFEDNFKPYEYCNKDHKDKAYTKEQFLTRDMPKEVYRFPVRSSDEYGWHKPIDNFVHQGYGRRNLEGGGFCVTKPKKQGQR